jgi:lipid-binding SYLF domain-containing protein
MPNFPAIGDDAVPMNGIRMLTRQRARAFAMSRSFALAAALSAVALFPAHAETGTVRFKFFKAGWFIGAQSGTGILSFRDKIYPFRIGGISGGLTFGGSATDLVGTARNMRQASDIEGVYTAVGAGIAVGAGGRAIQMRNGKGVVLTLEGKQLGVAFDFDLSGMNVSIQKQ